MDRTDPDKLPKPQFQFPAPHSEFTYVRTYSRWLDDLKRRETYPESVDRYITFLKNQRGEVIPPKVLKKIKQFMLSLDVMPSMRAFWSAGPAAERDNTCTYNCSFLVIDSVVSFSEALYILECGTGVGFSVESRYIDKLPSVPQFKEPVVRTSYIVPDSAAGWADSVKLLMSTLYDGQDIDFDYSKIRKKGERLKTMGGRASGPEPLITLHGFIREIFQQAQGRKLKPIECHDILNEIAHIVVVGGVRRSSEISLSDLDDKEMARAKILPYPGRRAMANNSTVYYIQPKAAEFIKEWGLLAESGTGERGIFNLAGARLTSPERRDSDLILGTNPCGEIMLRDKEMCNLSEVVVRPNDDLDSLLEKVECATWIGSIQSTFTYFPYLRKKWQSNCEEERLLGVSLTGQMDNLSLLTPDVLKALKSRALKVNKKAAAILGINQSVAITCVKPSGTVSLLVNCSPGQHTRGRGKWIIRRIRLAAVDPLVRFLRDQGVPLSPENGERKKDWEKAEKGDQTASTIYRKGKEWSEDLVKTWVASFPVAAPIEAKTDQEIGAMEQLEHYRKLQQYWCEHNASLTVYVKDNEWLDVGNWVYKNWDIVNGISFLPYNNNDVKYEQLPEEEIAEDEYKKLLTSFPVIDYSRLSEYEKEDGTTGAQEFACVGGQCLI